LPQWQRGIRIGSVKDGKVTAFIPDADQDPGHPSIGAENVAADDHGNVYGAEVVRKMIVKYEKH